MANGCSVPLAPGTALGTYRIVRLLARGGHSRVYQAVSERGEAVAIKAVREAAAQRWAGLRGAGLRPLQPGPDLPALPVIEAFERNGCLCTVMPLARGLALPFGPALGYARSATDTGPQCHSPTLDGLAAAMAEVADALQAVHDAGLLHGDLKPAHLVRNASGQVVFLDWDHAFRWREGQPYGGASTPGYAAPEWHSGHTGPCSEVYALGACLLFALTGLHPLPAAVRAGQPMPRLVGCPPPWQAVLDDSAAWSVEDRIPTAALLAQRLRDLRAAPH